MNINTGILKIFFIIIGILFSRSVFGVDSTSLVPQSEYLKYLNILRSDTTYDKLLEKPHPNFQKRKKLWKFILGEADDSTKYVYNWKTSEILDSFKYTDARKENINVDLFIEKILHTHCQKVLDSLHMAVDESAVWLPEEEQAKLVEENEEKYLSSLDSLMLILREYTRIITGKKSMVKHLFYRMPHYICGITGGLVEYNLPPTLMFLVGIESRYIEVIESNKSAVGLYQFIPGTARDFGLIVDSVVDERRSEYYSRVAFFKYMRHLHNTYPKHLFYALVSYFTGTVYNRFTHKNSLEQMEIISDSLAFATSNYIPSIIALRDIFIERYKKIEKYSTGSDWYKRVTIPQQYDLANLPTLFSCSKEKLLAFNQQFKIGFVSYTLPANYSIRIPVNAEFYSDLIENDIVFSFYKKESKYIDFYASLHILYSFIFMNPESTISYHLSF